MRLVGQWLIFIALSLILLVWGVAIVSALVRGEINGMTHLLVLLPFAFVPVSPGLALWIGAWIVEGFGKDAP
ncbi:MAG: hypothetical protein ACRD3N_18115 [Terracidiphilus sp.]